MTFDTAAALVIVIALNFYALMGGADYGGGVWDLLARGPRANQQRDVIAQETNVVTMAGCLACHNKRQVLTDCADCHAPRQ